MDCEKFDRVMLDLFYDELDEITSAAARRHTDHCTRCRDLSSKLRATREVGALPLVDPPDGLVERILLAEQRVRAELPARQRFGRAISVLAGYAMRPQLAMAALLLLVIGSSLLLLRGRPGEQKNVLVTERGVPESESDSVLAAPVRESSESKPAAAPRADKAEKKEPRSAEARAPAAAPAPAAAAPLGNEDAESQAAARASEADRGYEEALTAYRDRRYDEAQRRFNDVASRGGENAASAALYAAQSARARSGCPSAAVLFEQVRERYPDSPSGQEASWQAAGCYRTLGDFDRARHNYETLLQAPGFADRAQAALASLGDAEPSQIAAERVATAAKRARPAAAAAPARAPAAAPPKGAAANTAGPAKESPRTSDTK